MLSYNRIANMLAQHRIRRCWLLKERDSMFVRANDIAQDLDVSVPYAYKLIRELNAELKARGFMTVSGRVSRQFYEEKFYGIGRVVERS
jgi:hypothetical protein